MTNFTPEAFREHFPEFADTTTYPDSQIDFWASAAGPMVNATRWGELTSLGVELVTAHHLVMAIGAATNGGAVGGPVASKSVDKVSVSYDTSAYLVEGGSFWNMTTYGVRYLYLSLIHI